MSSPFTVSVLSSIDPVARSSVAWSIALDDAQTVVIQHDLSADGIRRAVSDATGVIETEDTPLEHACLSCAIREDLLPTLQRLMALRRWSRAVVALPVTAESAPVTRALHAHGRRGELLAGLTLGPVVCAVDGTTIADDAFSSEFVEDRGLALVEDDGRVVAEAVAPMLAHADVVAVVGEEPAAPKALSTVGHLRGRGSSVVCAPASALDIDALMSHTHRCGRALGRVDPLRVDRHVEPDAHGVWSIELASTRPFHPGRLRDNIARLGSHDARVRGHFWVPSRPGEPCAWDGAGRQLSVGTLDGWGRRLPATRLVVTGRGAERAMIESAFRECLIRDDEWTRDWSREDDLSDWLGPVGG
ncbi:CobW family GTP-binding protein [Demequina globuliformis]|uniref:CobW family GTP-binding protein n=1 Tax=Demequina globuliformis TaxID=676202 RepID=UPI0007827738|nr:GTP-binding protein [Demequina globuliformis]